MTSSKMLDKPLLVFLVAGFISLIFPVGALPEGGASVSWLEIGGPLGLIVLSLIVAAGQFLRRKNTLVMSLVVTAGVFAGGTGALRAIQPGLDQGIEAPGLWLFILGLGFFAWRAMAMTSYHAIHNNALKLLVPTLFGVWLLFLWQMITTGFQIPSVLLPSPAQIGRAIAGNTDILAADFYQTYVKSVLSGFAIGCGSGFIVAILVDRIPFLQRGLLPLGSLVSAIPIVGIAPVMVMWFGFDWQSKAAVIVVMTFFPMLVNTLAGLEATSHLEKDLMRSYAASYIQTLIFVRLPNALPFIFNALKINSTLALIGAIVAEFFGTPIVGMGFRISTEVGRMNVDVVWASITVAAIAGSVSYGLLALLERSLTFWHPSYRSAR